MMKTHLNFLVPNEYGGHTSGTLCGRENKQSDDGTNSTHIHGEVTCKFCLNIMADSKHWRYRKYIAKEAA